MNKFDPNFVKKLREYRKRRSELENPFDRIALDNEWLGGVPVGLLLMVEEGSRGERK